MALIAAIPMAGRRALALLVLAGAACRDGAGTAAGDAAAARDSVAENVARAPADEWTVTLRRTGGIEYGMAASAAASALGGEWADTAGACARLRPARGPGGLSFMVEQGRIVRVDVDSAGPATAEGATVGMTEADVRSRYPGIRTLPHKYDEGGRYLVVVPAEAADSSLRLIFETDGARVVRYRAGLVPQVEYVEGCG